MKMRKAVLLMLAFSLCGTLLTQCAWSTDPVTCESHPWMPGACETKHSTAALKSVTGCNDLLALLKQNAIEEMESRLNQNLEWALEWGGCGWYRGGWYAEEGDLAGAHNPGPDESGASEYSTTNTQEAGVDEADFVKNDGTYIYLLAGNGLMILKAWPAQQTHEMSFYEVEGIPRKLYVHNDHAVIYSEKYQEYESGESYYDDCYWDGWEYYCGWQQSTLNVTVLDISNRALPVLEREIQVSGSYMNSRRIGDAVHTVMTFPEVHFPDLHYWPDELEDCSHDLSNHAIMLAFARLMVRNRRIIERTTLYDWLPSIRDTRYDPSGGTSTHEGLLDDCQNFYEPSLPSGQSFLTVMSLDIQDPYGMHLASIVGQRGEVYSSSDALYVATHYVNQGMGGWFYDDSSETEEATTIHKFSLSSSPAAATYEASGVVKGRVLNQFSMGEYKGFLRVATTTGYVWHPETHNSVFVLGQNGSVLETAGMVTGIAPTEDIRSARFVGDRGFIVTFKKTDPLYAIDLSDPRNPRIAGELKIPGFSTYIHMMDEDHLLTIGFDADDQGSFAWFQGIELQIFDVSDLSQPTQVHKEIIGTRGSSSEATGNHLAFNYFPPKNVLALPMAICEGSSGGGSYGDRMTFSGLMVWDVTVLEGFHERGRVPHEAPDDETNRYGCSNWWTNPNSRVKRSIIMDDYVYSISDTLLKVNHLSALSTDVVTLELPPIPQDPYGRYW
jgi:hypothetical protein